MGWASCCPSCSSPTTVRGFDAAGKEAARVTIEEPVWERPKEHLNSI